MRRALPESVSPELPTLKTWPFMGHPLDQGNTGTCVAHTAAHFIHSSPIGHRGYMDAFELYREVVRLDEYTDNDHEADGPIERMQGGSSGTGGAKALHKRGLITEYLWSKDAQEIIAWVLTRGPVMVGTNWYRSMFKPTPQGYLKIEGANAGGHEWLLRMVNLRKGIVGGITSWGPQWNPAAQDCRPGHFLMGMEEFERLIRENGDGVSAIEVPRKR